MKEKSALILVFVALHILFSFGNFYDLFFIIGFEHVSHDIACCSFSFCLVFVVSEFLISESLQFSSVWKTFSHYFFTYISYLPPLFLLSFRCSSYTYVRLLVAVSQPTDAVFIFFSLVFFLCLFYFGYFLWLCLKFTNLIFCITNLPLSQQCVFHLSSCRFCLNSFDLGLFLNVSCFYLTH